ncbi:hypothetical protein MaudCBS49596_001150 [Microsporum audouinii]
MSSIKFLRLPLRGSLWIPQVRIQSQIPLSRTPYLYGPLSASTSTFSTRAILLNAKSPRHASSNPKSNTEDDPFSTPSVSLESLGIGKNMKVFLLAVLCVLGTVETWFWCKAIWTWWKGGEKDAEAE